MRVGPRVLVPLVAVAAALVVLIIDPIGFWEFHFGAADLRSAVEGTWSLKVTDRDGVDHHWRLSIAQASHDLQRSDRGWIAPAAACGNRSLIRNAEACEDLTEMPLEIVALDAGAPAFTGSLRVFGLDFETGALELSLDGPLDGELSATVMPDGKITRMSTSNQLSAATLVRIAPAPTTLSSP